ncbi:hypothetical protein SteCoe_24861 [Stentor coeruleus]|uniref:Uncharacterized protein n=1 Tax=Stentor coeruleus TaxID=5963 RepID=A0A1R2BGX3_9CILI|nr:hypothetical protein SteCoe_24861 [Stentor coeruleus]
MILLLVAQITLSSALSCKDMNGNAVDWFSLIKPPKSDITNQGQNIMYLDPLSRTASIHPTLINNQNAISFTINQLNNKTVSSFIFNDQPPIPIPKSRKNRRQKKHKFETFNSAHAKGIIAYDKTSAFYIMHSFPLYPNITSTGIINTTISYSQLIYGQNMICITLTNTQLFNLAGVMSLIQPSVYYKNILIENANITNIINNVLPNFGPSGSYDFTLGGFSLTYIAKNQFAGIQLWDDVVSKYFKQDIEVESWGRPYILSVCPPNNIYHILNIAGLQIQNIAWIKTQDHSKWGILMAMKTICYGDMNRMTSQASRGGGALCLELDWLFTLHNDIITDVDPCGT